MSTGGMSSSSNEFWSSDSSYDCDLSNSLLVEIDMATDDEEMDDEEMETVEQVLSAIPTMLTEQRNNQIPIRDRMEWDNHVQQLMEEGPMEFTRMYRICHSSFLKIVDIVRPSLIINETMSQVRAGNQPILPEISVHCLLRWLAGGSYLDIRVSAGISTRTFYRNMKKCIDAILQSPELSYSFPTDLDTASSAFNEISTHGAILGCVACVDGYLLRIQVPSSNETPNVKSFYSGHYQTYGLNIQAACDHRSRFVSVCVAAPGSTSLWKNFYVATSQQSTNWKIYYWR
jgi:hypothetical protein